MKKIWVASALLFAGASSAQGLNYDRLDVQWDKIDTASTANASFAGVTAAGERLDSFGLTYANRLKDNWLITANYWSADGDGSLNNQAFTSDAKKISLAAGYIVDVAENQALDFQAEIGQFRYSRSNLDERRTNTLGAAANYRWKVIPRLELSTGLHYTDFRDQAFADELAAQLGIDYRFSGRMSIGASYRQYEDSNATTVRLRIAF